MDKIGYAVFVSLGHLHSKLIGNAEMK